MALLEVSHLTRTFGGLRAVSNVWFGVEAGEILGLIGPNGAGKTTVFDTHHRISATDIGADPPEWQEHRRAATHKVTRRGITRTFQIVKPFPHLTVRENATLAALVRLGTRAAARAESERVLEQVGLANKLDTPASDLTLSEQKRMEIARALATGPKLLLLDEPLGGLNASEIGPACELIQHIRDGGVTIVLVEHVMKAIMRISHRVVVMSQGEKIADAVPTEIVNDPAVSRPTSASGSRDAARREPRGRLRQDPGALGRELRGPRRRDRRAGRRERRRQDHDAQDAVRPAPPEGRNNHARTTGVSTAAPRRSSSSSASSTSRKAGSSFR